MRLKKDTFAQKAKKKLRNVVGHSEITPIKCGNGQRETESMKIVKSSNSLSTSSQITSASFLSFVPFYFTTVDIKFDLPLFSQCRLTNISSQCNSFALAQISSKSLLQSDL